MTFRAVVHPETVIGSDAHFGGTQSINNNNNNPLTNCTVRPLEQTIIAPVSSTISRNSELQHYDLVANAIANSDEYKEYLKKEHQQLLRADAFKAIVLLSDVRQQQQQQQQSSSSRTGGVPPTSKSTSTSTSSHVWEGRVLDERIHAGERYFLPSAVHTNIITFYHHGIRDCQQLYAGRVVAVFGSIMTRDSTTNAIVSVALNHIITAPSIGYGLNPNASLLTNNTKDGKELVDAMIKRNNNNSSSSAATPTTGIQRIHFCPIPSHFEDESKLLEDFLRDTILYLTEDRSSSLVVFVGALVGRTKSNNASTSSSGGVAAVQRTNIAQKMRVILTEAVQKNQREHVPLMFVPGVDDLSLRPSVIPQSNLFLPNGEQRIAPSNVHLPSNPAVFYTDKEDSTGLTIVATSVDIQNALLVHSVSKENNKLINNDGGEQAHPRPPKLSVCADTLLRSGLCVPYLQDTQYEEDLYVIEPSSLPELTVTPHIHFSPTSVVSSPQAFIHGNGTLFVSCNVGPVSFAQGGRCTVMEVDVAPGKLGGGGSPFLMSKESVRVRAIDFIRYKQ